MRRRMWQLRRRPRNVSDNVQKPFAPSLPPARSPRPRARLDPLGRADGGPILLTGAAVPIPFQESLFCTVQSTKSVLLLTSC